MPDNLQRISGSFRDPSGFVYKSRNGIIRTIQASYAPHSQHLADSGLLNELWEKKWLVKFAENKGLLLDNAWKVIDVERVPFISYPYEWSFSQLKAAALLTLDIHESAINKKMTLKDASAYNIQFVGTRPVFIDILSFAIYQEGKPWIAYGQFCRHFLAPLLLMAKVNINSNLMLRDFIDGIPLDITSSMLHFSNKFSLSSQIHVHIHSKMQQKHADTRVSAELAQRTTLSRQSLLRLNQSLRQFVEGIHLPRNTTIWGDYYTDTNYSKLAFDTKHALVASLLDKLQPNSVLDMGANTGEFSRLAKNRASLILAADMDALAVERHYANLVKHDVANILPLIVDLANPSPALGWHNQERDSFIGRCNVDVVLALALIHHLCIGNNVPLHMCAELFASLAPNLILEFVPKTDSQVQRLLATREDIFSDYTLENTITAFSQFFNYHSQHILPDSSRIILLFTAK